MIGGAEKTADDNITKETKYASRIAGSTARVERAKIRELRRGWVSPPASSTWCASRRRVTCRSETSWSTDE